MDLSMNATTNLSAEILAKKVCLFYSRGFVLSIGNKMEYF